MEGSLETPRIPFLATAFYDELQNEKLAVIFFFNKKIGCYLM
jgi:hypothetical protein